MTENKIDEFNEQSLKVRFLTSSLIDVSGEEFSVKEDQILNLPRKLAHLLEKEGKIIIEYPDVMAELKQTLSKEKMAGEYELSTIDDFFYLRVNEFLCTLEGAEKNSFMVFLNELFRMRNGKIIKFASTSPHLLESIFSKLSFEEIDFLKKINTSSEQLHSSIFPNSKDDDSSV
ncbi:MAG: hypothetical protein J4F36_11985 [Nitrosopumilaceae archaeon]|nr:hypothetical protein [Nitrosopumilaceae archaeon]